MGEWLRASRHHKRPELMKTLAAKLRGHWNYYGIIGNSQSLSQYYELTKKLLHKWLNRRSQKRSQSWLAIHRLLDRWRIPRPKIVETGRPGAVESCELVWNLGQVLAVNLLGKHYRKASA